MNLTDWNQRVEALTIPSKAFINGKNADALSGKTVACINPANNLSLGDIADCGPEDADLAVNIARQTFEQGPWSAMAPAERKKSCCAGPTCWKSTAKSWPYWNV